MEQQTQKQIEELVRRDRELGRAEQEEQVTAFLMDKAFELVYSLGGHKDPKNAEYVRKRREYQEVAQNLGEMWYIPSSRSINIALANIEKTVQ